MKLIDQPGISSAIADEAGRRIAGEARGLTARALGDYLNAAFCAEPATRDWLVTRRDIEMILSRDERFICTGGLWLVKDGASWLTARHRPIEIPISALRGGYALDLRSWQRDAITAWIAAGRRGIVQAVTGSGKTRVGLAAIEAHLRSVRARAAVIVPTIELQAQWLGLLRSVFSIPVGAVGDGRLDDFSEYVVLVYVARSAAESLPRTMRHVGSRYDVLLVADECHRYGSGMYAKALDGAFSATLGLSATPERDSDDGMLDYVLPRLGPIIYEYGHDVGVDEKVISDFRLCFVGVNFAPVERAEHEALSQQINRVHHKLVNKFPFLEHATPFIGAVKELSARDEEGVANVYLQLVSERRRLLDGASSRHSFVSWLAESKALGTERFLVFHETISDCEYLAKALNRAHIPAGAHHSDLRREERARTLNRFARGDLQAIVAPRTLDEGIDVPDASLAIIVAGTRVKRQLIQRIGRVIRTAPGKKIARVIKVFIRGASDDPSIPSADLFSRDLLASGRAVCLRWPEEGDEILHFLGRATSNR